MSEEANVWCSMIIHVTKSMHSFFFSLGGVDYVPLNTTIIFRSGMAAGSSLCVSIGLLDDIVVEANQESFLVSINGTDPAAIIEAATTPIYIHEDSDDGT